MQIQELLDHDDGFSINLASCNLKGGSIGFVTKFTRVVGQIKSIDFGNKKIKDSELEEFGQELRVNKYIRNVCLKKKGLSKN